MIGADWQLALRYVEDLQRVRNLIRLYRSHPENTGRGRTSVGASDILRAATVFLHATFEDMCRTVERHLLPLAAPEQLAGIPLVSLGSVRPEKFLLSQLAKHRGETVDAVIESSIEAHLVRTSYNSVEDLCALLKRLSFSDRRFRPHFPSLAQLCERRHHIVHQADRNERHGAGHHQAQSISQANVTRWIGAIEGIYYAFQNAIL